MHILSLVLALAQAQPQGQAQGGQKAPVEFPHRSEEMEYVRTETGFVVPAMKFEADATLSHLDFDDFRDRNFDVEIRTLMLEAAFGIADWAQAEVKLPYLWVDPDPGSKESGIGDIVLEGKASLREGGASPIGLLPIDVAVGFRVTLPTGDEDEGLGRENETFGFFGAVSYPFLPWLSGHGEIWNEWQDDFKPIHGLNAAAEFTPWMRELSLTGALNFVREGGDPVAASLVPGAEFRFGGGGPPMSVGLGIPIGLTSRAADIGFIANFQIRF